VAHGLPRYLAIYVVSATICCVVTVTSRAAFGDLSIYSAAGTAVLHGAHLYQLRFAWQLQFTYPPFAAMAFVPLAVLPAVAAEILVTAATVIALPVISYLALRLPPVSTWLTRDQAVRWALAFATAAIWLEPMRTNLKYGQINVFVALLVVGDLAGLARRAGGSPFGGSPFGGSPFGGVLIGVAAGIKLTPAIFAVYLLATRRYRAAATAAGAFAATVAMSFIAVPGDAAQYWRTTILNPARVGRIQNVANQSLLGALARTLHTLNVDRAWLPIALVVAMSGIALAAMAGRAGHEAYGFALCAVTGLLVSPISWSHHWVLALPALLIATVAAVRHKSAPALIAVTVIAVAGWARLIWRVPTSGAHLAELNLTWPQLLAADAYVLAGLAALAVAAVSQASTSAFHRRLSSSGAKQASNEFRASPAVTSSDSPNTSRTAAKLSSTYPPK
jgi:alpha-1,2-mannosyltransferase